MASNWGRIGDGSEARQLGASIARLIFGDRQVADAAYRQRMAENMQLGRADQALQQDIMKTDAKRGLGDALQGMGVSREMAEGMAQLGRAGLDPRRYMGAILQGQERDFRAAAVEAARAGDWTGGNAHMLGVANAPVPLAGVDGNMLIANRFKEGGGEVKPTDVGYSTIGLNAAKERGIGAQIQADLALAAQRQAGTAETYNNMHFAGQKHHLEATGNWNPDARKEAIRMVAEMNKDLVKDGRQPMSAAKSEEFIRWFMGGMQGAFSADEPAPRMPDPRFMGVTGGVEVRQGITPVRGQADRQRVIAEAHAAVQAGAPRDAVRQRLRQYGIAASEAGI